MNWLAFFVSSATTVLIAAMMFAMPSITQPTLPLGVSIPSERVGEPVIRAAVGRYRVGIVVGLMLCLIVGLLIAAFSPFVATLIPTLLMLVLAFAVYVGARGRIQRAKAEGRWYKGVPVRLSAQITAEPQKSRMPVQPFWYLGGLVLIVIAAAIGVGLYTTFPSPMPTHWNGAGIADGFAPKSVWSVFGPLMIGTAVLVFLYVIAAVVRVIPPRARTGAAGAAERAARQLQLTQGLLGQLALVISLELSVLTVVTWTMPGNTGAFLATSIALPVLLVLLLLVFMFRLSRPNAARSSGSPMTEHGTRTGHERTADVPDDDRYWKGGIFYVNRDDPALFVPKRFGVGWTINAGHPGGIAILLGLVALIVVLGFVIPASVNGHHP